MSPLADIFNDIVKTLGGTPIDYRKKEGKRVALGTKLVGFGNNPYGSGKNSQDKLLKRHGGGKETQAQKDKRHGGGKET